MSAHSLSPPLTLYQIFLKSDCFILIHKSVVFLNYLETQPICHSTVISKHYNNSGSSCIENDKLRLLCKVKYVGDIPPTLIWKNISNKNNTKSVRDGNNEVHNSIEVTTNWNQFIFVCETASSQRHCYSVGQRPLCE